MTALAPSIAGGCPAAPAFLRNILTVAKRELREAVHSRWFILYTVAFVALGLGVSYISAAASGSSGLAGYGRTTAGLINIILLVVPLMALTAGAGSIAGDRERGTLAYMLAQPVSRTEVLLGKYLGLAGALVASIGLGLGLCSGILAWKSGAAGPAAMLWFAALSTALALAMLSVGMLISTLSRKVSVAVGAAVFLWLVLVFISDLGLMAGTLALKLRIEDLFALSLINPLQVFKMWSLHAIDSSLDVLGPAGLYASEELGSRLHAIFSAALAVWVCVPLTIAGIVISRRSPI